MRAVIYLVEGHRYEWEVFRVNAGRTPRKGKVVIGLDLLVDTSRNCPLLCFVVDTRIDVVTADANIEFQFFARSRRQG